MPFNHLHPAKRQVTLVALAASVIIGTVLLCSCNRTRTMPPEEAMLWIAAYAPAHIDQDSRIRIELTDLMMSRIDTGRSLDKAFTFSPKVNGKAICSQDRRFIDFLPARGMKQGRKYECHVNLREITDIDSLGEFVFDFHIDKREVRFEDVRVTVDPDNISYVTVRGRLEYNVAAGDSVAGDSSFIVCSYPEAKIVMDNHCRNHSRGFCISGLKRHAEDATLILSINPMGGFSGSDIHVTVPSVSDFNLLKADRVEAAEPYLNLEFSAPLSGRQELDGLITIDNVPITRIERTGTNVKIYYPANSMADLTLRVSDLIKNSEGRSLDEAIVYHFEQSVIPPAIEIPFSGNILPDSRNLKLPFRAVNLAAVDVEVVKVFPNNVMRFFQENNLDGTGSLRSFGRLVYHKTVRLDRDKSINLHQWQNFSIDLKNLFTREHGALYNIRLTFRKAYSLYNRCEAEAFEEVKGISDKDNETWDRPRTYIYRDAPDYNGSKYRWNEAQDPTKDTYYMVEWDRMPEVNLVASRLGLIVKRSDENCVRAIVNDIMEAAPAPGITVTAYNYQLQKTGSGVTDENGFTDFRTENRPYIVSASDGKSTTYLKVASGLELPTNNFDVDGLTIGDGLKGFIYGERGIWRPGDEINLTLIVEDKEKKLPSNHPVVMELYNPDNQLYSRQVIERGTDGFYAFRISTEETVPTGLWMANFKVGNRTFSHAVRIETIKPNRLKIDIMTPEVIVANQKSRIGIHSRWLTGPAAKDMAACLEMTLYTNPNPFADYKNYTFKNPLVSYTTTEKQLYSGVTDSLGNIVRDCTIGASNNSPGMLQANITARVTEPGGDASIVSTSVPYSPFEVYVGLDMTESEFETDREIKFPVAVVNQYGKKLAARKLEYKIYRLDWNWWWEGNGKDLNRYVKSSTAEVVASGKVDASAGMAEVPFKVEYPDWGKYLVLVRDIQGGHTTGGMVTVDWPEWRGRSNKESASGSTELSFTLDKAQFEVGETAYVYLPKCRGGRVLLSIETGSRILKRFWAQLSGDRETKFPIQVDKSMAPNFYVTATMLRPHKETDFDTPIRLFGVQSVKIIDKHSILHPVIDMPDELHPQQQFRVKISEKDNKPMTYTLAIVDEGLLDITNFRTPRPWHEMNRKEALGIRTWDMYDDVIGSFGAKFRSIHSVGGDEALRKASGQEKRFNPAVKFIGPFTLKGGSQIHRITLPNYVGSVRVMVVAAHDGTYGSTDKTVKVTSPLMLLPTLPRSLANCDTVTIPVNIFALEEGIREVAVSIDVDGPAKVTGSQSRTITFSKTGEQLTGFQLVCDNTREGTARVILRAEAAGNKINDTTYIEVANRMPVIYRTEEKLLSAKGRAQFSWNTEETDKVTLQISSMPALNFSGFALFMENYPHLCTEQLSSKALFMLFGRIFLEQEERSQCEKLLPRLIKEIQSRQLSNGGFVYWPGQNSENARVTSMAGLALTEASRQGFRIDKNGFEKWKKHQETEARDYRYNLSTDLDQALRLYTLAMATDGQTAAMNRLRESKQLSSAAAYCLACTYAEAGRKDVARNLIARGNRTESRVTDDMFYSETCAQAIELQAYSLCGMTAEALSAARKITSSYPVESYVTQDIAFATMALNQLSKLVGSGDNSVKIDIPGGTPVNLNGFKGAGSISLDKRAGQVTIENLNSKGELVLSLLKSYKPRADKTVNASARNLEMNIRYTNLKGSPIEVGELKQDTEFYAEISVKNRGDNVDNLALTYRIPSGWEIRNDRLSGYSRQNFDNCDVRDNSCNFYFGLKRGGTKTVKIRLRAVYSGHYLLPPAVCEDMYNPGCRVLTSNSRVSIL